VHPESNSAVKLIPLIKTGSRMALTGFSKATADNLILDQYSKVKFLDLFKSLATTLEKIGPESLVKGLTGLGENPGYSQLHSGSTQVQHLVH
jgi:hypothetical protein